MLDGPFEGMTSLQVLSAIQRRLSLATGGGRAREFATRYFRDCEAHFAEAVPVHKAIELLGKKQLNLDSEARIVDPEADGAPLPSPTAGELRSLSPFDRRWARTASRLADDLVESLDHA